MTDEDHDVRGDHGEHSKETLETERETAPQSPYSTSQVGTGIAVLVVGLIVAFGIPLAVTL